MHGLLPLTAVVTSEMEHVAQATREAHAGRAKHH